MSAKPVHDLKFNARDGSYARRQEGYEPILHEPALMAQINPARSETDREALALSISASMEEEPIFAGQEKPYRSRMPMLERIAIKSFVQLGCDMKPADMHADAS